MLHGNPRVHRSSTRGWAAALVSALAAAAALGCAAGAARAEEWPVVPVQHFARTFEVRGTEAARVLKFRLDEAQRFVRECRSDLYDREMSYFLVDIDFFKQSERFQIVLFYNTEAAAALRQNVAEYERALQFLRSTRDARFRDCVSPPRATTPTPAPGTQSVPPAPRGRFFTQYDFYADFSSGVQFDQFKETTLGTIFVPGADRPFLFSRGAATGFNVNAGILVETPVFGIDLLNIFPAAPVKSEFSFRFTNSSATASGSTAPP